MTKKNKIIILLSWTALVLCLAMGAGYAESLAFNERKIPSNGKDEYISTFIFFIKNSLKYFVLINLIIPFVWFIFWPWDFPRSLWKRSSKGRIPPCS